MGGGRRALPGGQRSAHHVTLTRHDSSAAYRSRHTGGKISLGSHASVLPAKLTGAELMDWLLLKLLPFAIENMRDSLLVFYCDSSLSRLMVNAVSHAGGSPAAARSCACR